MEACLDRRHDLPNNVNPKWHAGQCRESYTVLHRAHRVIVSIAIAVGTVTIKTLRALRGFAISGVSRIA